MNPFDLHVLGTPPALILSQDQTLHNTHYGAFWGSNDSLTKLILNHFKIDEHSPEGKLTSQFFVTKSHLQTPVEPVIWQVFHRFLKIYQPYHWRHLHAFNFGWDLSPQTCALLYCSVFKDRTADFHVTSDVSSAVFVGHSSLSVRVCCGDEE